MTKRSLRKRFSRSTGQALVALLCSLLLAAGDTIVYAQPQPQDNSADQQAPKLPNDQLDSLVAPIALYPDPLLSQVLVASTYPLEVVQLQQWLAQHQDLKDQALVSAVEMQDWDPSIQAMAPLPDVVKQLADNIKWTTDLGNAFLAQQSDVMDAVQRMRAKAQGAGNLKSTQQMKVETQTVESKTVIVIQQANPQVIYVPSYNPVVVYGPPIYPYPAIYYPPVGYYAAGLAIGFGIGIAMGSYYRGGWGWGCGWGGYGRNNINININNNYISHYNKTNINNRYNNYNKNGNWQHNPQHRGGAPYSNRATATKYGGTTRGDSAANRQANARQQQGFNNRAGSNSRPGSTTPNRGGANANTRPTNTGAGGANRGGSNASSGNFGGGGNRGGASSGDRVGNREVPKNTTQNKSAFGGASSRANAQATSSRGAASMGGGSHGGGGGGARAGGGGGRRR
jgi:hypothetical protein